MSKLTNLIATQTKLTAEVAVLESFLTTVVESQSLTLGTKGVSVDFEPKDAQVGTKVVAVMEEEYFSLAEELEVVNAKVAALEVLVG